MKKMFLSLVTLLLLMGSAHAQNVPALGGENKAPIEISAEKTLEWHQKDKQYIADGAATAQQGDITILAEKLIADYRDDDNGGKVEIWQLTAEQNVQIKNTDSTVIGDRAVYNVDTGIVILTGNNLKLTTPDQLITAQERMEYDTLNSKAKAIGKAKITRGTDTLSANSITAIFTKDKDGKQVLKTAHANGNVVIKTPEETLTGNTGIYNAANNTAEVKGNVKIVRGPNMLEGARAEINLTTNISKMFGAPETGKRVKGVFFPSSKNNLQKGSK